jgi:hypothetical protein
MLIVRLATYQTTQDVGGNTVQDEKDAHDALPEEEDKT